MSEPALKKQRRTKAKKKEAPLAYVIKRLRERAIATKPGESIGSEEQLIKLFNVSRPTFRNAAAILSQEQLLAVKRGPGGGYFAVRPKPKAVAHMAAIYLQSRKTKLEEVLLAIQPVKVEMAVLAAKNREPETVLAWRKFQELDIEQMKNGDYLDFLKSEREFGRLLGRACNNSVLDLFHSTLYDYCSSVSSDEDLFFNRPDRIKTHWEQRSKLVDAIIDGDEEMATLLARRNWRTIMSWMVEQVSKVVRSGSFNIEFPFSEYFEEQTSLTTNLT